MRRYLVVANQTLGGEALQREIEQRAAAEPCEFFVLVPATPARHLYLGAPPGLAGGLVTAPPSPPEVDDGRALAESRLERELARLRGAGLRADGAVGDPEPVRAIDGVLREQRFDEIILATLPQGVSRWLGQDLPHRVQRKFDLPVTHVVAEATR